MKIIILIACIFTSVLFAADNLVPNPEIINFKSGDLNLSGELFKPSGKGPFPAILWNHGSAPGMLNSQASKLIGPYFTSKGWIFFMPYRRGQGLSSKIGTYIGDEIAKAGKNGDEKAAAHIMLTLLKGEHLNDQRAALSWLKNQSFVNSKSIAVGGNSFGGIETILGSEKENYCASLDLSGGAESWAKSAGLQQQLKESAVNSKSPILFIQAENDFDLTPSKVLSKEMELKGKANVLKIYPSFGKSNKEGHSFAYLGVSLWFNDAFDFINHYCKY